jgi:hypothetical protein
LKKEIGGIESRRAAYLGKELDIQFPMAKL